MKLHIPYGKLSGYTVGKILKHFIVDVEASKTAELLGLNRKTIDDYFNKKDVVLQRAIKEIDNAL